ncbi:hypothetical protein ACS0TY_018072 [Phlomoides rotata]
MAISTLPIPAIFVCLFLTVFNALASPADYQALSSCSDQWNQNSFECELKEAKLKIARLELVIDERIGEVNAKSEYFRNCEKKIEGLTAEIDRLKTVFSNFELDYSRENLKLSTLEEEVRLLWAASRKNNFEIHNLEQKALDAERRLKEVTSRVEETAEIVTEQWIQIQQLEQAVHMAEVRVSKIRKELWGRCPFFKFFMTLYDDCHKTLKEILDSYGPKNGSMLAYCKSRAFQTYAAAKHYHHQLQDFIRHEMKSNYLTAALAHEEVVFFVASALVAFPLMSACMVLLSQFS